MTSIRAHSANESARKTLCGAKSVLDTYKKAEQNFKESVQDRLSKLVTEESDSETAANKESKVAPRYMSWRPKNYQQNEQPVRKISSFQQAAAAAKRREANLMHNRNSR